MRTAKTKTPRALDTFYSRSGNIFSRITAWGTQGYKEGPTVATHQGKFLTPDVVLHAVYPRVKLVPWYQIKEQNEWCITRYVAPWDYDEGKGIEHLIEMIGWRYSWMELILQGADGLINKMRHRKRMGVDAIIFRRLGWLWKKGVICSKTGCRVDIKLGIKPTWLEYASPDDSLDYELAHEMDWVIVDHSPGFFQS